MDPDIERPERLTRRLPRTRGDGPLPRAALSAPSVASPHTRGWTVIQLGRPVARLGFPAHAGMDPGWGASCPRRVRLPRTRGDGPALGAAGLLVVLASPHTRGWTRTTAQGGDRRAGFPAHAGMDRCAEPLHTSRSGLPRTRGDGPPLRVHIDCYRQASPHTRGWTAASRTQEIGLSGFPAHAGMDLCR